VRTEVVADVLILGGGGVGVDHWHPACTNPCCKVTPEEMMEILDAGFGGSVLGLNFARLRNSHLITLT